VIPTIPYEFRIHLDAIKDEWVVEQKVRRYYGYGSTGWDEAWHELTRRKDVVEAERVVTNLARPIVYHYDEQGRRKP
jgi:hypothetical protein